MTCRKTLSPEEAISHVDLLANERVALEGVLLVRSHRRLILVPRSMDWRNDETKRGPANDFETILLSPPGLFHRLEPLCQGLMGTSTAAIDWIEITGRLQQSTVGPQPAGLTEISACIAHHRLGSSEYVERSVDLSNLPHTSQFAPDTL